MGDTGQTTSYGIIEEILAKETVTLLERLDAVSVMPVTNEEERMQAVSLLQSISTDMQALSAYLMEGSQRESIPGIRVGTSRDLKIPSAPYAQGGKGQAAHTVAGATLGQAI